MASSQEERPSFAARVCSVLSHVTVEPVFFLSVLASSLDGNCLQLLSLYKICLNTLHQPEWVCANMSADAIVAKQVQDVETNYHLYRSLVLHLPLVLVSICMGAWSDKHNRKIPMIIAKVGIAVGSLLTLLNAIFMNWPAEFLFIPPAVVGLTGGSPVFSALALSYVADRTRARHRIWRFGLLEASSFVAFPIGTASSGYIQKSWGFIPVFAISTSLRLLCILYLAIRLQNLVLNPSNASPLPGSKWRDLLNWKHFVECVKTCTKNRHGHHRCWILLILLANWTMTIPGTAEGGVSQLYFLMHRHWSFIKYSNYLALGTTLVTISLVTLMPLLSHVAQFSNPVMELIGNAARIVQPVIVCLSTQDWMVWSASALVVFYPFCYPAMSSMLTQLVEPDEIGKVLSIKGSSEVLIPLFSDAVYTQLYKHTKTIFPGAFLLLSASFCAVSAVAFLFLLFDSLRLRNYHELQASSRDSINKAVA